MYIHGGGDYSFVFDQVKSASATLADKIMNATGLRAMMGKAGFLTPTDVNVNMGPPHPHPHAKYPHAVASGDNTYNRARSPPCPLSPLVDAAISRDVVRQFDGARSPRPHARPRLMPGAMGAANSFAAAPTSSVGRFVVESESPSSEEDPPDGREDPPLRFMPPPPSLVRRVAAFIQQRLRPNERVRFVQPARILSEFGRRQEPLFVLDVKGDGNCFFRSVSLVLFGTEEYHADLRAMVCHYLDRYTDTDADPYRRDGVYVDNEVVYGLAAMLGLTLYIWSHTQRIWMVATPRRERREIVLDMNSHRTYGIYLWLDESWERTGGEHYQAVIAMERPAALRGLD